MPLQRYERVEACEELLARCEKEGNDYFLCRIITGDQSCFYYYYQPELPKQWKRADSPLPTKLKQEKLERKVLRWDYNSVILKESVPAGTTITKKYYVNLLINKLHPEIKK